MCLESSDSLESIHTRCLVLFAEDADRYPLILAYKVTFKYGTKL